MIPKLMAEHDHLRKTLNLLESQFLSLCRGEKPDYAIMRVILVYVQEYLEQAHHPLEDIIFSVILKKGGEEAELARKLITDHTELEVVTRKLRESIELLKGGANYDEEEFKRDIFAFLTRQRQHLYNEEMIMYPLVEKRLTKKDWKSIKSMAPQKEDPVFGEGKQGEYELLFREIESRSK